MSSLKDTASIKAGSGSSLTTDSFTVGANANRVLYLIAYIGDPSKSVTSMASAGETVTFVKRQAAASDMAIEVWRIVNPAAGARTATVTLSGSVGELYLGWHSVYNADQATPNTVPQGTNSASWLNGSVSVTGAAAGDLVLGFFGWSTGGSVTASPESSLTSDYNSIAASWRGAAAARRAASGGADTVQFNASAAGFNAALIAFAVNSATGGDTTAPTLTSPTGTATGSTTATVGATTDEGNGTLYAVVTTSATAPTKAQVKAGQNAAGTAANWSGSVAVSSTGAKALSATGLTASTTYYAHLMHEDAATNQANVVSSTSFTTSAGASGSKGRFYYQFGSPQC